MPVTQELLDKIKLYEDQGYSADEIIGGLSKSQNFPDVAKKTQDYLGQQYSSDEILKGMKSSPLEDDPSLMSRVGTSLGKIFGPSEPPVAGGGLPAQNVNPQPYAGPVPPGGEIAPAPDLTPSHAQGLPTDGLTSAPTALPGFQDPQAAKFLPELAKGLPEAVASTITGMAGFTAGKGYQPFEALGQYILRSPDPMKSAREIGNKIASAITYQPKSDSGQVISGVIGEAMDVPFEALRRDMAFYTNMPKQYQEAVMDGVLSVLALVGGAKMTGADAPINSAYFKTAEATRGAALNQVGKLVRAESGLENSAFPELVSRQEHKAYQRVRTPETNPALLLESGEGPGPASRTSIPPPGAPPAGGGVLTLPEPKPTVVPTEPIKSTVTQGEPIKFEPAYPGATRSHADIFSMDPEDTALTREDLSYRLKHDDLTGLKNRSEFFREVKGDTSSRPSEVGQIDFDKFKSVNDIFGHEAGDAVLRVFGKVVRYLGLKDHVFRVGGEEFGVRGLGDKHDATIAYLNDELQYVKITAIDKTGDTLEWSGLPFSHGRATITTPEEFKTHVDKALYVAKEARKSAGLRPEGNRVSPGIRFSPETERIYRQRIGEGEGGGPVQSDASGPGTNPPENPKTPQAPVTPTPLPDLPTAEQAVGEDRIARLSEDQKAHLEGVIKALAQSEAKKHVSPKQGEDGEGYQAGSGFDLVREVSGMDTTFDKADDIRALQKAIDGKKLGVSQAERVKDFLRAHREMASHNSDIEGQMRGEDQGPFDRGGWAGKDAKNQENLGLGTKGKDLKSPKKNESKVDAEDSPLFKAAKEARDRAKQGSLFPDAGGWDLSKMQKGMEQPEIVRMIKKLEGEYPTVNKGNIRTAVGQAIGSYNMKTGQILISSDVAKIEGLAVNVLAHEVMHGQGKERGNIFAKISSQAGYKENMLPEGPDSPYGVLTDADRARLKDEAKRIAKQEKDTPTPHEGAQFYPPEAILSIWRDVAAREKDPALHDFISRMSDAEKKAVVKAAMRGISEIERDTVLGAIRSNTVPKLSEKIKAAYEDLLRNEIIRRKLFEQETITTELKKLTQMLKPFDEAASPEFTKYRHNADELWADGMRTLLVDPQMLQDVAPTFRKAVFNWIDKKPEFKAEYERLQALAESKPDLLAERQQHSTEGYQKAEEIIAARRKRVVPKILHEAYKALVEKNADSFELVEKLGKDGMLEDATNPRYWIESLPYINGKVYTFLHDMSSVLDKDITMDQFGEFFERMRAATEREAIFNPGGMDKKASLEALDKLKADMGPEKYKKLAQMYSKFQAFWQHHIVDNPNVRAMWSESLYEYAKNNKNYATFQHVFELDNKLESQIGGSNTASVHYQKGSFGQIRNPFISTMMKGMALIRSGEINAAKENLVSSFLKGFGEDTIQKARGTFNGKYIDFKEPKSNDVGMITVMRKGKVQAYYVPKEIADTFEHTPHTAKIIMELWNYINIPLRNIMVTRNPLWMAFNVPRDFMGTLKNVKDLTAWQLAQRYVQAGPQAARLVWGNKLTEHTRGMYDRKEVVVNRAYSSDATSDLADNPNEINKTLKEFGFDPNASMSPVKLRNKLIKPLMWVWDQLGKLGEFSEKVSKIAGSLEMQDRVKKGKLGQQEASHTVRQIVGTPDIHAGGAWKPFYNNVFLFSNVAVRGWKASWESFRGNKAGYTWKTMKYNVLPKLIMAAAAYGLIDEMMGKDPKDKDSYKSVMGKVGGYYKSNYLVVPLGLTKHNKAVVLTLPQDYTGQVFGGLMWYMSQGKMVGQHSALSFAASQSPYGLNPLISLGGDMFSLMQGRDIYDDYRQRAVPGDENARKAKDWEHTYKPIAKYEFGQVGGSGLYRFNNDDPAKVQTELEKMLGLPMNPLSRFIKVTDSGEREQLSEGLEPTVRQGARDALSIKDAIKDSIKSADGRPSDQNIEDLFNKLKDSGQLEGKKYKNFRATYKRNMVGKFDDVFIEKFASVRSDDERAALLKHAEGSMAADKFNELYDQLIAEGYLKRGARRHFNQQGGD